MNRLLFFGCKSPESYLCRRGHLFTLSVFATGAIPVGVVYDLIFFQWPKVIKLRIDTERLRRDVTQLKIDN